MSVSVIFSPLSGGKVCTNGVPFARMVQLDAAARNDKTWRRFGDWHLYFHRAAAEEVEETEVAREWLAGLVGDWAPLDDAPQRIQVVLYKVGGEVIAVDYGYDVAVNATFAVVVDGHVVFSAFYKEADVPYPHWGYKAESMVHEGEGGWKIIAHLSCQARNRAARVAVAARHGQMAGMIAGHLAQESLHRGDGREMIALMEGDFEPAKRGGYIVKNRGEYIITRENTPGFYRITRETERVRFARLVEAYSSMPCPAGIEECAPDVLIVAPFAVRLAREYAPDDLALGCDERRSRAEAAVAAIELALAGDDIAALAKAVGEAAYWQGLACGCAATDIAWEGVARTLSARFGVRVTRRKALQAAMHAAWNILASRQFDGVDAAEWALNELRRQLP